MTPLDKEIETYNANLPTLIKSQGKFVLIKGDSVVDLFDTYGDAMKRGYDKFKLDPFLVKRIMPPEQSLFISRSITPCQLSTCL